MKGSQVLVTVDPKFRTRGDAKTVWVDYHNITQVVAVGGRIYIDDGLISLVVRKIGTEMLSDLMRRPQNGSLSLPLGFYVPSALDHPHRPLAVSASPPGLVVPAVILG